MNTNRYIATWQSQAGPNTFAASPFRRLRDSPCWRISSSIWEQTYVYCITQPWGDDPTVLKVLHLARSSRSRSWQGRAGGRPCTMSGASGLDLKRGLDHNLQSFYILLLSNRSFWTFLGFKPSKIWLLLLLSNRF